VGLRQNNKEAAGGQSAEDGDRDGGGGGDLRCPRIRELRNLRQGASSFSLHLHPIGFQRIGTKIDFKIMATG
jgi:hypothetical protein